MNNEKPLTAAASKGSINSVRSLIESLASVHSEDGDSPFNDAFCAAAENGHTEIVELLLNAGADVHSDEDKALRMAVDNGHTNTVELLISRGADIHARGGAWPERIQVLTSACSRGHIEIATLLLDGGAKINVMSPVGTCAPLSEAVANGYCDIVEMLIARGAYFNGHILYRAIERKQSKAAALLLDRGSFDQAELDHALFLAAQLGLTAIISLLLDHGADIHVGDDQALISAAKNQQTAAVELLLDKGARIDAKNNQAVRDAAWEGRSEMVEVLLGRGADRKVAINVELQRAAKLGDIDAVKESLTRGADIHADGGKALAVAAYYQRAEIVALLVDRGELRENNPDLALVAFASTGNSDETRELIKQDADIRSGQDVALKRAIRNKHPEIVRILAHRYDIAGLRAVRDAMDLHEEIECMETIIIEKVAREKLRDPGIEL